MHRRGFFSLLALSGAAVFTGCAKEGVEQPALKPAPDFTLKTLDGKPVSLARYRGKVVLVDFWGTYCPPCMEAIPGLVKLRDQLHPSGFEIIGVACDLGSEGKTLIAKAVKQMKISYPIVRVDDATAEAYAVDGLPAVFLIDRQGNVVESYVGATDYDALEARVRGLMDDGGWRSPTLRTGG